MDEKIRVVLYQSKTLADGRHPVMIQLGTGAKRRFKGTGVALFPNEWDSSKEWPKKSAPNYIELVEKIGLALAHFKQSSQQSKSTSSIGTFVDSLISSFKSSNQYGNATIYNSCANALRDYIGSLDRGWDAITPEVLQKMVDDMRGRGLKDTTIHVQLRTIRALYNRAVEAGEAKEADSPFKQFRMKGFNLRTAKRCLSKEQVKEVIGYKLQYGDLPATILARDLFAFSYLCGGVPFCDLARLTSANVSGQCLIYVRQKTHQTVRVGIPQEAMELIKRYAGKSNGYLFPVLDATRHVTEVQKRNAIHRVKQRVNRALHRIGENLGIKQPLTTYVARHSFATVLKREGVPLEIISEALGHQSIETTKIYLDGFSADQLLNAQSKLL